MGAFLDIIHGLYSLCWSQPVEWPRFVDQYVAWYRSQSTWDSLARAAGFIRIEDDGSDTGTGYDGTGGGVGSHYAVRSHVKQDGTIGNIIKAYYATYVPIAPGTEVAEAAPYTMSMSAAQAAGGAGGAGGNRGGSAVGSHVSSSCAPAPAATAPTLPAAVSIYATAPSLYGGMSTAPAATTTTTATTPTATATAAAGNTLYGSAIYGSASASAGSAAVAADDDTQEQPHKRLRTEEPAAVPAATAVQAFYMSGTEPAVELFESRRNRGYFYYTTLNSSGQPAQPRWVPVSHLLTNTPVEAMEHPIKDFHKVYVPAEQDARMGRRVKKINYIVD